MRGRTMPTLSYRTSDGACHRVLVAAVGDCPLVLDVADGDARLVDRLDAPGEGPEGAAALGADHCPQCPVAQRPLHGPPPRSPAATARWRTAPATPPPQRASRSRECAAAARSPPDAHVLNH